MHQSNISGALCYAELGTLLLESGGEHAYMKASFGRGLAFVFSWTECIHTRQASQLVHRVSDMCTLHADTFL